MLILPCLNKYKFNKKTFDRWIRRHHELQFQLQWIKFFYYRITITTITTLSTTISLTDSGSCGPSNHWIHKYHTSKQNLLMIKFASLQFQTISVSNEVCFHNCGNYNGKFLYFICFFADFLRFVNFLEMFLSQTNYFFCKWLCTLKKHFNWLILSPFHTITIVHETFYAFFKWRYLWKN